LAQPIRWSNRQMVSSHPVSKGQQREQKRSTSGTRRANCRGEQAKTHQPDGKADQWYQRYSTFQVCSRTAGEMVSKMEYIRRKHAARLRGGFGPGCWRNKRSGGLAHVDKYLSTRRLNFARVSGDLIA
jgi:hypothetical protein